LDCASTKMACRRNPDDNSGIGSRPLGRKVIEFRFSKTELREPA